MIGQSDIRPQPFTINELSNGIVEILFYENVTEFNTIDAEKNLKIMYEFGMYELSVQNRIGLIEEVEKNYDEWLGFAKGQTDKPLSYKEKIQELSQKATETEERMMMAENVLIELMME